MFIFVLTIHFILCAILVGLVLIQQGKGADMGAAFGAGGSNSLFGAGGATSLIVRITTATAVAFMVTSILLINLSGSESGLASVTAAPGKPSLAGSVMEDVAPVSPTSATSTNTEAAKSVETSEVESAPQAVVAPAATVAVAIPANEPKTTTEAKEEKK